MFFEFVNTSVCNIADDTTPFACDMNLENVIKRLECDITSVIYWFSANFMILNESKCHFLISTPNECEEHLSIKVGGQVIWESMSEVLLGVKIDKEIKFEGHIEFLCKNSSSKLSALTRMAKITPFDKKKILMQSFVKSQFSHCPLVWMFCSRKLNDKINSVRKRALRIVYLDYNSSFAELLEKDKSVTIHQRNLQLLAIEMFKIVKKIGPELMREIFKYSNDIATRSNRKFQRPNVETETFGKSSTRDLGPILWDQMLPAEFKNIPKLEKFQRAIKKWSPKNCPCSLCKEYLGGVGFVTTFE